MLTENILSVYRAATPDNIAEGMSWYDDAHKFARTLDKRNPARGAGVIAALSPMSGWDNNKNKARQLFTQKGDGTGIGMRRNVNKAIAIYNGADPLDVLGGNKVRAFYSTILDPTGDHDPVIDRHAFDIAMGRPFPNKGRSLLERKGEYARFAQAYREGAKTLSIGAAQLQAITWVAWREALGKAWYG